MPGIVVSFDASKQTAVVQPAIKRIWVEDGPLPLPQCVDVPVQFPRGGNFVLTFPIARGDEVLLCFSERAIDNWWDRGGVQEPAEVRSFDLSDAFAIPGVSSRPRFLGGVSTDACELRTLNGAVVLRLENGTIYLGGKAGAEKAIMGESYRSAEGAMDSSLVAALTAFNAVSAVTDPTELATFIVSYPTIGATITALKVFLPLWLAAVQGFEAKAPTFLTTKARVL